MRSSFLLAALSAAVLAVPGLAQTIPVPVPNVPGGQVKLVPRDQLRAGPGVKTARLHPKVRAAIEQKAIQVPPKWDWTTTESGLVKLPMYGNDQYGDCYYVTLAKQFILYQWNVLHTQLSFDQQQLIRRYLQLSGGDNGLSDSDVFPELKKGVIGPNGPHKALDVLIVPSSDKAALALTGWAFGPHMFTFTVYTNFSNGAKPGATFTGSSGRAVGGHAVPFSGRTADGYWQLETWGMQPSIKVSDSWVQSVDPEFISVFSLEWFDSKGYAPNGQHYRDLAALWNSMGGKVDPVGPFPAPGPTPPVPPIPTPPPPTPTGPLTLTVSGDVFSFDDANNVVTLPAGWKVAGGVTPAPTFDAAALTAAIRAGKVDPLVILMDGLAIYTAYKSGDYVAVAAAVAKLIADLQQKAPAPATTSPLKTAPKFPAGSAGYSSITYTELLRRVHRGGSVTVSVGEQYRAYYAFHLTDAPAGMGDGVWRCFLRAGVASMERLVTAPVRAARAVANTVRDGGAHWTHPGNTREGLIQHLLSHPNHASRHTFASLQAMSYEQLEALHDADHNGTVQPLAPAAQPIPTAVQQTAPVYQLAPATAGGCPNGQCPTSTAPARRGLFGWR